MVDRPYVYGPDAFPGGRRTPFGHDSATLPGKSFRFLFIQMALNPKKGGKMLSTSRLPIVPV
jgi:hypothetical protein